jgi:ubiquinone/menaquinone biosynthesis C-methylase UbiE
MNASYSSHSSTPVERHLKTKHEYNEKAFKQSQLALSKTAVQFLCLQALKWASRETNEDLCQGTHKRAIDVGSAYGYVTSLLNQLGYDCLAFDISRYALNVGEEVDRVQGDAQRLPFRDNSINVITCFDTIEHLNYPAMLMEDSYRCLCKGGILLAENPVKNPIDVISDRIHRMADIHPSLLTWNRLESLALKAGFGIFVHGLLPIPFQRFPVFGRFVEIRVPVQTARRVLLLAKKN